jgi:hypothetical protein
MHTQRNALRPLAFERRMLWRGAERKCRSRAVDSPFWVQLKSHAGQVKQTLTSATHTAVTLYLKHLKNRCKNIGKLRC